MRGPLGSLARAHHSRGAHVTRAADRSTLRRAVVLLAATVTVGCSPRPAHSSVTPARSLFIWAGPHGSDSAAGDLHHRNAGVSDFLAVLDADPASATYGKVLASDAVGIAGAMAHHTEYTLPAGRPLFATANMPGKAFLPDLPNPLAPPLAHAINGAPGFRRPPSSARLPSATAFPPLQSGNGSA